MKNKKLIRQQGSALVAAIFIIGLASVVLGWFLMSTNSNIRLENIFSRGVPLQNHAQSGFDIARVDLLERARRSDFTSFSNCIEQGLVSITPEKWSEFGFTRKPRITRTSGNIQMDIFYFPDENNGPSGQNTQPCGDMSESVARENNLNLPKFFHVVSQAKNLKTGESYTKEGLIKIRLENWAEFSFGMLNPKARPGVTEVMYKPATYSGHVHFGLFDPPTVNVWFHYGGSPEHRFQGPVTFEKDPGPGKLPFKYHSHLNDVIFEKGYKTNYKLNADATKIFSDMESKARVTIAGDEDDHICLKFQEDGTIDQYGCNQDEFDVFKRYEGETTVTGIQDPIHEFHATGIIYSKANIHVKGVINGSVTIASGNDIYIEGDLQYANQGSASNDRAGFIAKRHLRIPTGVPNPVTYQDHLVMQQNPLNHKPTATSPLRFAGVTNFIVENDRDAVDDPADTEYPTNWHNPNTTIGEKPGEFNTTNVLDLDGMFMAVNGGLMVEGINDYEDSPTTGITIPAVDGKRYTLDPTSTTLEYYYVKDGSGNIIGRKSQPLYSFSWHGHDRNGIPMLFNELPRPTADRIWINGGLVVNEFTNTKSNRCIAVYNGPFTFGDVDANWDSGSVNRFDCGAQSPGFTRRVIHHDPRFYREQPPGFPDTNTPLLQVEWTKEFRGPSHKLTGLSPSS